MTEPNIVTRFAPSPTGLLHGGNYRTAVFSYLFARKTGGTFILRIEDTDRARSKKEYEDNIIASLKWLGLEYDAFHRQSEYVRRHEECLRKLIANDNAYLSKEAAKDGSGTIREIVRFRNPRSKVSFTDLIRGTITIDTTELGDFVIARAINEPLFHLAVVVDDHDMGVTHIIRGEDHIANTPRQLLLYDALGFPRPTYAHLPLVLDASRAKLSKRRGAQPITYYRDEGYLPEAMLNFLAMIGWNPGTPEEIFTREELIAAFSIERIQKSSGVFNSEKLEWVNKEHIKRLTPESLEKELRSYLPGRLFSAPQWSDDRFRRIIPVIAERITHFGEIRTMAEAGEFDCYFYVPEYAPEKLIWKGEGTKEETRCRLGGIADRVGRIDIMQFTLDNVKDSVWDFAETEGRGKVLWPMRFALSGREKSPDPFQLAEIFGKDETLERLHRASESLTV